MKNQNSNPETKAITIESLQAQLLVLKAQEKESTLLSKAEKKAALDAQKEIKEAKKEVINLFNSEFRSFSKMFRFISKNKELISKGYCVPVGLLTIDNVCNVVDSLRLSKKQSAIDNLNARIIKLKAQNSLLIEANQPNSIEVRKLKQLSASLTLVETKDLNAFFVPFSINTIIRGLK